MVISYRASCTSSYTKSEPTSSIMPDAESHDTTTPTPMPTTVSNLQESMLRQEYTRGSRNNHDGDDGDNGGDGGGNGDGNGNSDGDGEEESGSSESGSYKRRQETEALQLKKILEWELSLDARDLRSHAWYHGAIARAKAEQIVTKRDGDFLVRDCTSQPGNYVLSCRSKAQNLHFVINKIVLQPNTVYESVQYRFEDDSFDTVPDLITYYVGSGKPITVASAARILNPQNRQYPLSFYGGPSRDGQVRGYESSRFNNVTVATTPTQMSTLPASYSPTMVRRRSFAIATVPTAPAAASVNASYKKQRSLSLRCGGGSSDVPIHQTSDLPTHTHTSSSTWLPRPRISGHTKIRCSSLCADTQQQQPPSHAETNAESDKMGFDDATVDALRCDCKNYVGAGADDGSVRECDNKCNDGDDVDVGVEAPPKPSRISNSCSFYTICSSSDSGNGSDDSVQSSNVASSGRGGGGGDDDDDQGRSADAFLSCELESASATRKPCGVIIKNPKYYSRDSQAAGSGGGEGGSGCARNRAATVFASAATSTTTISTKASSGPLGDYDDDDNDEDVKTVWDSGVAGAKDARVTMASAMPVLVTATSHFDLDAFHTLLLPACENKPLDTCALQGVHMLLMDSGSRMLANHLTRADLELTVNDFCVSSYSDSDSTLKSMCKTGIELSLLPHGHRRRLDLIERSECLRLMVAITILTCATELERAELLNKWIEVAIETKTALGNLFGFCGIMLGLCTPQVQRLSETWHILRQRYTDSAFNFEAKLRPTLKSMNESTNPLAPNTTIPHLLPAVLLYEKNCPHISGGGDDDDDADDLQVENTHLWDACIKQWETSSPDLGLSTLYSHLNATRQFYNLLPTFRRNAEIVLTDSKIDHLLCDVFRTEFHVKFLWGSRGAKVSAAERYSKFQPVLNVMSEKCETANDGNNDGGGGDNDSTIWPGLGHFKRISLFH